MKNQKRSYQNKFKKNYKYKPESVKMSNSRASSSSSSRTSSSSKKKSICNDKMDFQECELAILRQAVDKAEEKVGKSIVSSPEIKQIFTIVENFIRTKKLIPYGGIAINAILPKSDQFYNRDIELPDFDFFSPNALEDTKELCDIYVKAGFVEVEGKPGIHQGTFKVFVNFIPVADITFLNKDIFNQLKKDAVKVSGILYAPPNFLRMSMYLELSRPSGDTSRWEKVMKRLTLMNKSYPLHGKDCDTHNFQREMENTENEDKIFETIKNTLIDQGVVFFGGYAMSMYSNYMPKHLQAQFKKVADFDVLSEDPETTATILKERLTDEGIKHVKIVKRDAIGEIIAPHLQIMVGKDTVAFIYEPIACHSYNIVHVDGQEIKIATIDTMLSFYLAFLYSNRNYYDPNRILCMAQFLFDVQQQNRLEQRGLLKRFSINCYGHQQTLEEMRAQKSEKYKELKGKPKDPEYEQFFLRYRPADKLKNVGNNEAQAKEESRINKNKKTNKTNNNKNKTKKRKTSGIFNPYIKKTRKGPLFYKL